MTESKKTFSFWESFTKALSAGFMATVILTISMGVMGMNAMTMLGNMFLGSSSDIILCYLVGGSIHFGIGFFYGLVYALLNGLMKFMHPVFRGTFFGCLITVVAYFGMPVLINVAHEVRGEKTVMMNPCNPCIMQMDEDMAQNPSMNEGEHMATAPHMNPCEPDVGQENVIALLKSLGNHIIFGVVLALMYSRGCRRD